MRTALLALVLAGCFFKPDPPSRTAGDAGSDGALVIGGTRRRVTITLPPAVELSDVPISIVTSGLDVTGAGTTADNIAFLTDDNIAMACEIVHYEASTGDLEAWVRVPKVSLTARTFQIAYGPGVPSTCDRTSVWTDYLGVWHFAEPEADNAGDSTSFRHDATIATGAPQKGTGIVGAALYLDESNGADMLCASHAPTLDPAEGSFSYEVWVRPDDLVGEYDIPMKKGGTSAPNAGFDIELGNDTWGAYVRDTSATGDDHLVFASTPPVLDKWFHLAIVVDRLTRVTTAFFNGALVDDDTQQAQLSVSGTSPLCFGDPESNAATLGTIDEARVHAAARIPAWIKLEYENLAQRGEFMSISGPLPK